MSWTEERVGVLTKLWADGLSASQIAAQLGGVTRNAVIGKVHRLGLSGRGKTTTRSTAPRAKPSKPQRPQRERSAGATIGNAALKMEAMPQAEAIPLAERQSASITELPPVSKRATIMMLTERTCRWPIGDPTDDDFHFCGHDSEPGMPYCKYHAKLAFQPVADRRRKAANG